MPRMLAAALLAVAVLATGPSGSAATPATSPRPLAPAAAAEDDIRVEASSRYELVGGDRVHVTVDVRLTNLAPPEVVGRFVETSVLDAFSVPVLAEAGAISVTQDGRPRPVDVAGDAPRVSFVVVDLDPDLQYGTPARVVLEYDLAPQPPRSDSFVRINPAFVSFPLFAIGDPGLADVEVALPEELDVTFVGTQPARGTEGREQVFRFDDLAEPERFTTTVAGRDDDALVSAVLEVAGVAVTVRAWPGDREWAEFVSATLRDGIPALEALTGRAWPAGDELDVVESASPYLYGYSGWFRPAEGLIEIGDELDGQVVLHELAHLWFNDRLFEGRWISEGLAETYAARARSSLGEPAAEPAEPDPAHPGAQPLEQWTNPALTEAVADERERYGYATSHLVVDRLVDAAGEGGMRAVLRAAADREISYVGDGPAEQVAGAPGWRRFLDLVEERTDVDGAGELFARYVAAGPADELARRDASRSAYTGVADAGRGWSPPHPLRAAMTAWDFDTADGLVAEATALLGRRDALLRALRPLGVDRLRGLEAAYERAPMDELRAAFDGHERAADRLVSASERIEGASGPLEWIGGLGDPAGGHLDRALAALEAGDVDRAERAASDAIDAHDRAATRGLLRTVAVLAIVGTLVAGWRALRSARGRRRPAAQP